MTDNECAELIIGQIKRRGRLGRAQLRKAIDPPGGWKALNRALTLLTNANRLYPRYNDNGMEVFDFIPKLSAKQKATKTNDSFDQVASAPIEKIELSPGRMIVRFGHGWNKDAGGQLIHRGGGIQSSMNSVLMGA